MALAQSNDEGQICYQELVDLVSDVSASYGAWAPHTCHEEDPVRPTALHKTGKQDWEGVAVPFGACTRGAGHAAQKQEFWGPNTALDGGPLFCFSMRAQGTNSPVVQAGLVSVTCICLHEAWTWPSDLRHQSQEMTDVTGQPTALRNTAAGQGPWGQFRAPCGKQSSRRTYLMSIVACTHAHAHTLPCTHHRWFWSRSPPTIPCHQFAGRNARLLVLSSGIERVFVW